MFMDTGDDDFIPMTPGFVACPAAGLDAIVCLALLGAQPDEISFVPPDRPIPGCLRGAESVGHPAGGNQGWPTDAADLLDSDLAAEVDELLAGGEPLPRFSLATILAGIRAALYEEDGLRGDDLDREVYATARPLIRGLVISIRSGREAEVADAALACLAS